MGLGLESLREYNALRKEGFLYLYIFTTTFMKVLLDIKDSKADFILELLKNFSFVKTEPLTPKKAEFIYELKKSVEEVTLAKEGKIKLQSAKDFLNEL